MEVFTIHEKDLNGRLDCFHYRPEFTDLEERVVSKTDKTLGDYIIEIAGGATPRIEDSDKYYTDDPTTGIPFLRVQNVSPEGLKLEDIKYITPSTHNNLLKRSQVNEYSLITKITGVGRMAVSSVAPKAFKGNINQHLVVIKTKDYETSKILAAFLNTDIGEKLAKRRSTGGTRPALDYQALKTIPVIYKPEIVEIMDEAYSKKKQNEEEAERLYRQIDKLVLRELNVKIPILSSQRAFVVHLNDIKGRFDPYFYQPHFTAFINALLNSSFDVEPLSKLINGITNGFDYRDFSISGTPYLKVSNIKPFKIDRSNVDFVDFDVNQITKPLQLKKGNILLTRKGTYGIAVTLNSDLNDIISSEIFKIETNDCINSNYLTAVLNSSIGQIQFGRKKIGAIMGSLSQEAVKSIFIPKPPLQKQLEIAERVENLLSTSEQLLNRVNKIIENAKKEVEKILFE